jgi:hypothetical protein
MATTAEQLAALQAEVARLKAAEEQREQQAEQERRAREIEQERKGPSPKRVTNVWEAQGEAQCVSETCPELFRRFAVDMVLTETTQFQKDASGNVTDKPETSWVHPALKNESEDHCKTCNDPLNLLRPGAKAWHDGLSRKGASDLENLRKLRSAEVQRVEVVTTEAAKDGS